MRSSREERSTRLRACKAQRKRLRVQDIRNDAQWRYATINAPLGAAVAVREAARVELRALYQTHGGSLPVPQRDSFTDRAGTRRRSSLLFRERSAARVLVGRVVHELEADAVVVLDE